MEHLVFFISRMKLPISLGGTVDFDSERDVEKDAEMNLTDKSLNSLSQGCATF